MQSDQSSNNNNKSKQSFTIISDDSLDGDGGYGAGTISLENMSPVIVDPEDNHAYVDMGAMHARSKIEKRVRYMQDKSEVPNPRQYWIVWVNVEKGNNGPYYSGVGGCELLVDKPNKRAFKSMPEHVTNMEKALKGKIVVDHMDDHAKSILRDFLKEFDSNLWENSTDELKEGLA